jgi:hypothetical protein
MSIKILFTSLEKVLEIRFSLVFIAILGFADCYMLLRHDVSVIAMNHKIIGDIWNINELFIFTLFLTLTFSFIIPSFAYLGRVTISSIISLVAANYPSVWEMIWGKSTYNRNQESPNIVNINKLKYHAINTGNICEYNFCCEQENNLKIHGNNQYRCKTIILFTAISYLLSNGTEGQSIVMHFINFTNSIAWYYSLPIKMLSIVLIFATVAYAFEVEESKNLAYLPGNNVNKSANKTLNMDCENSPATR